MVEFGKLRSSLRRLEAQYANHRNENAALSDLDREAIAESVIQRFKTCHDCLWKVLQSYLMENLGIADPPNSPKPVFRIAHERLRLDVPIEQWLRYADARTGTAHDHDGEHAKACLALVPDFIRDAIDIYETMSGSPWMEVSRSIDLTSDQRNTVVALIARYLPDTEAWAYGSRVGWTSRPQSDLDVVVKTTPEQADAVSKLREAFEDSNLPFRVNRVVWDEVPELFRGQIEVAHVVLDKPNQISDDDLGVRPDFVQDVSGSTSHWNRYRMFELCDITRGASPRPIHDWIAITGMPWVKIADASAASSRYISHTREYIRQEGRGKSVSVFPGDLILSNSASPGIPKFMGIEACIHDGWLLLRNFRGLDRLFTYYLLLHERDAIVGKGTGTVFTNLKTNILKQHTVVIPPLSEQRAIAHILGTLDDKIELNRRMNATLEGMARALFKDWFVDFRPVRAKMEGRDTGLPKKIADLFPDRLVDSGLGEIPEGWDISQIGAEVDVLGGGTPSTRDPAYWNGGRHCWATPKDLSKLDSPVLLRADRKITDEGVQKISSGILPIGTVLLTSRAPIGYLAINEVPTVINQGVIAMICQKRMSSMYVLRWCQENLDYVRHISGGSTFPEISRSVFRSIPVLVPPHKVLAVYCKVSRSLHHRVVSSARESELLVLLRDALLSKLISGQIRIFARAKSLKVDK